MKYPLDIAQGLSPGDVLCIPRESVWRFPEYIFLIREMKRLWNVSVRPAGTSRIQHTKGESSFNKQSFSYGLSFVDFLRHIFRNLYKHEC